MSQPSIKGDPPALSNNPTGADDLLQTINPLELARLKADFDGMKLIPWRDIWRSLGVAKVRGNREMIEVFYETLFNEAVFDDRGAWSIEIKRSH